MNWIGNLPWWVWILVALAAIAIRDIFFNRKHTITNNYPIVGHIRYMLEKFGPEIRQYFVANNREELPFNRSERAWIYSSSKKQNNYQGFGSDMDFYTPNYHFIKSDMMSYCPDENHINNKDPYFLPCAKVIGLSNKRKRPYRPRSIINISAMSYGSLSAPAITALNVGALKSGCFHNTGEGGYSYYHDKGADVVFQFGTGYFGVRTKDGNLSYDKLEKLAENNQSIRAIEIKLSQGAKPGKGGVLPASKISKEISEIRGVPMGQDVLSPSYHKAFKNVDELLSTIEKVAERTGLPVGVKAAIGKMEMWEELTDKMIETGSGPDFITIDGGEGGTGAAPPDFADHVALPFFYAFRDIYRLFQSKGLEERVVFIAAGKLGFPAVAINAIAMGVDLIYIAREAMMSIGCIQAQVCHNNTCPTGVATQKKWLTKGLHVPTKADRFANYANTFKQEVLQITQAAGYEHPCQFRGKDIALNLGDNMEVKDLSEIIGYNKTITPFEGTNAIVNCPHIGKQDEKATV
jgi:glutamate synthase domain-containing protein 2